jgi:uncharacterized membrane protein YphA (DoxX/SURF4 family)
MNPFSDALTFLTRPEWFTYVFWVLLLGGVIAAVWNLLVDHGQRTYKDIWMYFARVLLGCMWWQQSLWKLPPYYTDTPSIPISGLRQWMLTMVKYAAFPIQSSFVKDIVLAHFYVFAPMVYGIEVFIGATLILGIFVRLGAALGALMAINLWLGLYRSPTEWPWTYFFLILLQITFAVLQAGRNLGFDALIVRRLDRRSGPKSMIDRIWDLIT